MKILHVNDYRTGGGCEVLVARTLDLLEGAGVETALFTIDDVPGYRRTALGYVDSRRCRAALREALAAHRPDVVHLHNFYHVLSPGILAVLAAWKRSPGRRVVMTAHDFHLVCPNSGLSRFTGGVAREVEPAALDGVASLLGQRWDERSFAHSCGKLLQHLWSYRLRDRRRVLDTVICPSRFMQHAIERARLPTVFLPHPTVAPPRSVEREEGPLRYVFAGRVEPEKGLAELLALLPVGFAGKIEIIGDGAAVETCRRVAADRGLAAHCTGALPHDETLARVARAHVLVLPSLCAENYPMSLLEALSVGTNILVCDAGGMKEIVESSGVGYTFERGSASSLAEAIGAIEADHDAGRLNAFDVAAFLESRCDDAYVHGLLEIYRGRAAAEGGNMPIESTSASSASSAVNSPR